MRQSIFRKELSHTGTEGTVLGAVVATMNVGTNLVTGTLASSHDDFSKKVPYHTVEIFIENQSVKKSEKLTSEKQVLEESEKYITTLSEMLYMRANTPQPESFSKKMEALFSNRLK